MRLYVVVMLSATAASALLTGCVAGTEDRTGGPSPVGLAVGADRVTAKTTADVRRLLAAARFEVNRGQFDERLDFVARGVDYAVSLSGRGAAIGLNRAGREATVRMALLG